MGNLKAITSGCNWLKNSLIETVGSSKEKFYCKLSATQANPSTSSKTYCRHPKLSSVAKKIQ